MIRYTLICILALSTVNAHDNDKKGRLLPFYSHEQAAKSDVKPWSTEVWIAYYGTYVSPGLDSGGVHAVHISPYNNKHTSFLSIVHSHSKVLFKRPKHVVHDEVNVNTKTGELASNNLKDAQMIRYTDPKTKIEYFGIRIGKIYLFNKDHTKFPEDKK